MTSKPRRISLSWLPSATNPEMDFLESSFFQNHPLERLPSPQDVKAFPNRLRPQPDPVRFEKLGLIVKFGPHVTVEEALCLWAIRRVFCNDVPVPEVYGWRIHGCEVFIYMQHIQGDTLLERWNGLSEIDRVTLCGQLRKITTSFRSLEQDPQDVFIGSVNRGALLDYVFEGKPQRGPFSTVSDFHDWFSQLPQFRLPKSQRVLDPYRYYLPDDAMIKFTHGDLHRGNILISSTSPPRVLAIVDWAHGGFYPDYWEYCKAAYTSSYEGEWLNQYVPKFLKPRSEAHLIVGEYCMAMGSV